MIELREGWYINNLFMSINQLKKLWVDIGGQEHCDIRIISSKIDRHCIQTYLLIKKGIR